MSHKVTNRLAFDPIGHMLKVIIVALAIGVVVLIVNAGPGLKNLWADSAAWRVHHLPMLATDQEKADVARHDAFMSVVDEVKRRAQALFSN